MFIFDLFETGGSMRRILIFVSFLALVRCSESQAPSLEMALDDYVTKTNTEFPFTVGEVTYLDMEAKDGMIQFNTQLSKWRLEDLDLDRSRNYANKVLGENLCRNAQLQKILAHYDVGLRYFVVDKNYDFVMSLDFHRQDCP